MLRCKPSVFFQYPGVIFGVIAVKSDLNLSSLDNFKYFKLLTNYQLLRNYHTLHINLFGTLHIRPLITSPFITQTRNLCLITEFEWSGKRMSLLSVKANGSVIKGWLRSCEQIMFHKGNIIYLTFMKTAPKSAKLTIQLFVSNSFGFECNLLQRWFQSKQTKT